MNGKDAVDKLATSVDGTLKKLDDFVDKFGPISSKSEIHLNAGGIGVWIAVTCCFISLCVAAGALYVAAETKADARASRIELERQYDRMEDYQQTTYMLVPQLKTMVEQRIKEKENVSSQP